MQNFADRLLAEIRIKKTPLIVGLDPRLERLPEEVRTGVDMNDLVSRSQAYEIFCNLILDVVHPLVPAVKPQAAFFEQLGPHGMMALGNVVRHARKLGLIVIMDAKRGDIGSTATAYATGFLGHNSPWQCDALTVNPYLGDDSLAPFVDVAAEQGSGVFVLVKTSNPGGRMLQELLVGEKSVYSVVADHVQKLAAANKGKSGYGHVGAVVGATYPQQLCELREKMPNTLFLVPGFGAQGGTAADVAGAFDQNGLGAVINSSRAIIFAYENPEYQQSGSSKWQQAVEIATKNAITQIAENTSCRLLV